jgi:hypothetical protein
MTVVINEFELVPQPPPAPAGEQKPQPPPEPSPLPASEVERIVRRQRERAARVWAH